ncbi:MAG: DUF4357 domain-containing protein, partial [Chloroherpetonaceae bacterium]|nr:DUF4357 domain-containing protein [Chloroherpetonaceae bacterium]
AMQQENPANLTGLALELNQSGLRAKAIRTDEGFLVLKGSEANHNTACGLQRGYQKLRDRLIALGVLAESSDNSGKYIFQKDYIFDAPSAAACVILGRSVSGPQTWKSKDGKTLKEIEEEIVGARGAEGRTENEDVGLEDASPK